MTEPEERPAVRSRARRVVIDAALVVLCLGITWAVCFHHLEHGELGGGDNGEWRDEARERNTWQSVLDTRYYSGRQGPSAYYNPVQMLVWQALLASFDYDTEIRPYMVFLLIVHSLNVLLVYLLARELVVKRVSSFCAALCFGVFFPNWHTAGWAAAMITTGVSGLFMLAALLLFALSFRAHRWLLLSCSVVLYVLALFTKEFAVFTIPILGAYSLAVHRERTLRPRRSDLLLLPYCLATVPMAVIVLSRLGGSAITNEWGGFNFGVHMAYRFFDYLIYLVTAVPAGPFVKLALAACFLVAIPFVVWRSFHDRVLAFLATWLVISVSVYSFSNFRDLVTLQRYLYQPSVPWFLFLFFVVSRPRGWIGYTLTAVLCATVVGYNIYRIVRYV